MPSNCCCVPLCNKRGGHLFPVNPVRRKKWLIAIRRDKWTASSSTHSTVCHAHFLREDYTLNNAGKRKLRTSAVPSVFQWSKQPAASARCRKERLAKRRGVGLPLSDNKFPDNLSVACEVEIESSDVSHSNSATDNVLHEDPIMCEKNTQTQPTQRFSISHFIFNNQAIKYYTGLESYVKFCLVLSSLGPAAYHLNYRYSGCKQLSVEDQLFLTLIKLRRFRPNFELSLMFNISVATVSNIYLTWWNFMALQWREVNIWPGRDLTTFYMPQDFRRKFPKPRVILDGVECPIKRPKHPVSQQKTFSSYKNRHTIKCILGITPGGLVSHIPDCYGGSGSDRQLIERDNLKIKCNPKDSIMADKGFNVQDIFAPCDITVNIPEFFSKKNRMSNKTVLNDRKIASKRVHVERIIGLGKTYAILTEPLNDSEAKLASEILFICYMLCNFRPTIIPRI